MNPHFRQVGKICFKNAVIVADRYHVIRQVNWAMERVRKNEQNRLSARFRKYFKKSRYLLTKPMEKLVGEEMERLALMFEIAPRLADAYRLKNEFLAVIHSGSSAVGRQKLADWLLRSWSCRNSMTAPKLITTGSTRSSILWMRRGRTVSQKDATTKHQS